MSTLSGEEIRKLLIAAEKIHAHKLMLARGYETLEKRTTNERMRQLLLCISDDEKKLAQFWSQRITELGGQPQGVATTYLRERKVDLLKSILGTKGFFEWAVVGEDEGIQDLAVHAERIKDVAASETWGRYASDERMHLERMKTEVLGMDAWEIRGGGEIRDMIFGFNDGLVSTLAFVAGVVGAITDPYIVLLSAMAELFAGTISMAAGAYQSSKSELEVLEREDQRRSVGKGRITEEEKVKLIEFYQAEGFKKEEAEAIAKRITKENELSIQTGVLEELGLEPRELGNPARAGLLCGISFGLAALVPILPFVFPALSCSDALIVSIAGTIVTLFGVGAVKTIFSRKSWVWSGLKMMTIGVSAAAVTYMIGTIFSLIVEA